MANLYTEVGGTGGSQSAGTDRGVYDLNTFTADEALLPTRGVTGLMVACGKICLNITGQ